MPEGSIGGRPAAAGTTSQKYVESIKRWERQPFLKTIEARSLIVNI